MKRKSASGSCCFLDRSAAQSCDLLAICWDANFLSINVLLGGKVHMVSLAGSYPSPELFDVVANGLQPVDAAAAEKQ